MVPIHALLLSFLFQLVLFSGIVSTQPVDPDPIGLEGTSGYVDLPLCAQTCIALVNFSISSDRRVAFALGCATNKCLCGPDHLAQALQYGHDCTLRACSNYGDANNAQGIIQTYCARKGYTAIATATIAPESTAGAGDAPNSNGAQGDSPATATVTVTVSVPVIGSSSTSSASSHWMHLTGSLLFIFSILL
ncbi:hypothetical protein BKA62DRAFT_720810 [Auriculariales sp. MPI-PUGE-AT-0066]|nr:hypothetical protein BKA62DRAFT_720810 [Auriculariales sp. MPI-PUGE-AT-0066]